MAVANAGFVSFILLVACCMRNEISAKDIQTNAWAVKTRGGAQDATLLALKHGFLYDKYVSLLQQAGAPNDQMFQNTPEVSQMVFSVLQKPVWLIWSCPKNYLSVRMSQGDFGRQESSNVVPESYRYPCFHQEVIGDVLSLYRKIQETFLKQ